MKIGLIPPLGLEHWALKSDFHLTLPIAKTVNNPRYVSTYVTAAERGDYIVLDNGAVDGGMVSNEVLLETAKIFGAKELVAPDALYSYQDTISKTKDFLAWYETHSDPLYKVMGVMQGATVDELKACVSAFASWSIATIGIPKLLVKQFRAQRVRVELATWIAKEFNDRFEVHLLGASELWRGEALEAKLIPGIRSMDTSMAFTYALARQDLERSGMALVRYGSYFDRDWSYMDEDPILAKNVRTLLKWASVE